MALDKKHFLYYSAAALSLLVACGYAQQTPPAAPSAAANNEAKPSDPNNPLAPHTPGLYWLNQTEGTQHLTALQASSYGGSHSSGVLASGMSMGLKKAKWKAELPGAHAALRIPNGQPEFWFYFENAAPGFGHAGSAQGSKPQDFILARMEEHKDNRELVVGQASVLGNSSGIRPQDVITVNVREISPGVYKVTPQKPLDRGEYCFVPPGSAAAFGMSGGQLYDFGVGP